jgi:sterol 24-C-methyltransferase
MEGDFSRIKAITRKEKAKTREQVDSAFSDYSALYDEDKGGNVGARKANYTTMVNHFYDLATDFYEFGWGHSFHFATRHKWESFESSIARHEMWLAHKLDLRPGMKVLDVGCGVGGPMRTIARFSGSHIVGLNNNEYQIERGRRLNEQAGLSHLCSFLKADFMHVPEEDETYDAIYEVEATCHAPDKVGIYTEIKRLLKPGQLFAGYEWVVTDKYDPNNKEHVALKKGIEVGNGLPDLETPDVIVDALKKAGFEVLEAFDLAPRSDIPWYSALSPNFSITGFLHTAVGRWLTGRMVRILEYTKLAPTGTTSVHDMLERAASDLVAAGRAEVFSPMYFVLARKPLTDKE